jgi:hypothetical protein
MARFQRIDEDEVRTVRDRLLRFVDWDERSLHGSVRLQTHEGHRWWIATSRRRIVALRGDRSEDAIDLHIPKRALVPPIDSSLEVFAGERTEDGAYRQPAVLNFVNVSVEVWPDERDGTDWVGILGEARTQEAATAEVDRIALLEALDVIRRAPYNLEEEGEGWPPTLIRLADGRVELTVRWPVSGITSAAIRGNIRGEAQCLLFADELFEIALAGGEETLSITVPVAADGMLHVSDGTVEAALLQASADSDLEPQRALLERVLREGFGIAEPRRDGDGDYPFTVGDTSFYLRLARRPSGPPVVQVFSTLVRDCEPSAELLHELNALNASTAFCRLFHVDRQVLVEDELVLGDLHVEELRASCDAVADAIRRFRPLLRARFEEAVSDAAPPIPWEAFAHTLLQVRAGDRWVEFVPDDEATAPEGPWPFADDVALTVLTAHNPLGQARGQEENDAAQQALVTALLDRGVLFSQAIGAALDGTWSEPSLAVHDLPHDEAQRQGRQFGQAGYFVLRRDALLIVSCIDGEVVTSRPWRSHSEEPDSDRA